MYAIIASLIIAATSGIITYLICPELCLPLAVALAMFCLSFYTLALCRAAKKGDEWMNY